MITGTDINGQEEKERNREAKTTKRVEMGDKCVQYGGETKRKEIDLWERWTEMEI